MLGLAQAAARATARPGRRVAVTLPLLAMCLAGCRSSSRVGPYPAASVVLISIDTLRADHLPLYGYKTGSTPNLDALGREGIVFEDVYAQCPLTLPAHASLFTGLLPPHHGVRDNLGFSLKDPHRTLASRFKAARFRTGAAISAFVLRSQTGIARGFDFYDDALVTDAAREDGSSVQRDGAVAVDVLSRWIEAQGRERFFAFLHLYEPHAPYTPPERYRSLAPYDGEIAYADELVGRLLARLPALGLASRAIVAVTSDHGEGLMDHGEQEHGVFLYRDTVHVPWIVRLPDGARGGTRVSGTVAQIDIPATLLDLAGVPADGMDGVSVRAAIAAGSATARPVYSETLFPRYHFGWSELFAVTEGRYRYIRAPRRELYDVTLDRDEKSNVVDAHASAASRMDAWLARQTVGKEIAVPEAAAPEAVERLQALGYVGVGAGRTREIVRALAAAPEGSLPDPKDKIAAYEDLKRAISLRQAGKDSEAVVGFRRFLDVNPSLPDAWQMLGETLVRMGRTREGIGAFEKALAMDPSRKTTRLELARAHAREGRIDVAARQAALGFPDEPGRADEWLAQLMLERGDLPRAARLAARSVAVDGTRPASHFVLGVVAARRGRCPEALESFRRAEEALAPTRGVIPNLHAGIGDCLALLGRTAEAEREFLAEIRAVPSSEEGRVGLAMLYRSQGRDAEARGVLGGLIAALPRADAEAYWTVVHGFSALGDAAAAHDWAARARERFPSDPRFH
jgi:arylsulfatase A-like enzyme/Tfp pilus assembly protein PilF